MSYSPNIFYSISYFINRYVHRLSALFSFISQLINKITAYVVLILLILIPLLTIKSLWPFKMEGYLIRRVIWE